MLEVQMSGNLVVIDFRQRTLRGEHSGNEVIEYIKKSSNDFIFEIHVSHVAKTLNL